MATRSTIDSANRVAVRLLGVFLTATSLFTPRLKLVAQTPAIAPERVGIPLKFGTLDRLNGTLLGGPAIAAQIERTGSTSDPLRVRLTVRSLPDRGQRGAPPAELQIDGDGATLYRAGPVSGVRHLDDPASSSPVASDVYVLPLSKSEANALMSATSAALRARGKRVDVDGSKLPQIRVALRALLAAAEAGLPVLGAPAETPRAAPGAVDGGISQSSTVVVLQSRVVGGSGASVSHQRDSSARRVPATGVCGTGRICGAGWDLRITRFVVDDSVFAPNGFLQGRVTIENRGASPSDLSELRLCVTAGAQCVGELSTLMIPSLLSGERLELSQPIAAYSGRDVAPPYGVLAVIDPDKATSELNSANNEAVIRSVRLDTAALAVDAFEVPSTLREGSLQLQAAVTIRNASRVSSSTPRAIQLGGYCGGYRTDWGDVATRIQIPPLRPLESWTATLSVRHPGALQTNYPSCELRLSLLQSTRPEEREVVERRIVRPYKIERP